MQCLGLLFSLFVFFKQILNKNRKKKQQRTIQFFLYTTTALKSVLVIDKIYN